MQKIIIYVLAQVGSWALAKALQYFQNKDKTLAYELDVAEKVSKVRESILQAKDGTAVTKEQKAQFRKAVRDLIASGSPNSL